MGIDETAFLKAIATYKGAAKRLQKIAEQNDTVVFLDFAHSPSKLQATIKAVREQYPRRKLIACMELHTFSSLNAAFLPQYRHTMDLADEAIVFFNPEVVKHKRLPEISSEDVRKVTERPEVKAAADAVKDLADDDVKSLIELVKTVAEEDIPLENPGADTRYPGVFSELMPLADALKGLHGSEDKRK